MMKMMLGRVVSEAEAREVRRRVARRVRKRRRCMGELEMGDRGE
jgi:hypothetical protein